MRNRSRLPTPAAFLLAFAAAVPTPAPAQEQTRTEPLYVQPAGQGGTAGIPTPGLLHLPPGWTVGDAAAVVLSDGPWPALARERLTAGLLGEGAAVLEMDADAARGVSPDNDVVAPPPKAAELVPDVRGAVDALQRDAGAGLVVALGHGVGGAAALLAAAAARLRPGGDGLAAGVYLGPGPAAFALGGVPSEGPMGVHRGWPTRAARLCDVLAGTATGFERRAETDCREALLDRARTGAVRVAGP